MKTRTALYAFGGTVLVAMAALFLPIGGKTVELQVRGTPGLRVEGTCRFDGATTKLSGTVPFDASYQGVRNLEFSVKSVGGSGDLSVTMRVAGERTASAAAQSPPQGVRGQMQAARFANLFGADSVGVGTFTVDK